MSGDVTYAAYATHEVRNQPPARVGFNAFTTDSALASAVEVFGAGWAQERLRETGALVGSAHVQALARDANRFTPELQTHDRFGHRIDLVAFHPAWHELMGMVRSRRAACAGLDRDATRGACGTGGSGLSLGAGGGRGGLPGGNDFCLARGVAACAGPSGGI